MTDIQTLLCIAEDCTRPHSPVNGCEFCHNKGVPILPVRYAAYPTAPVRPPAMMMPKAPTAPTPEGYPALDAHHYTLRLLRPGYLYLFDERFSRLAGWRVTEDAKYQSYAIAETDANGVPADVRRAHRVDESPRFTCKIADHHVPASLIHWPAKGTTTVWLYYSELPIPTGTLRTLTGNAAWRSAHMQPITLTAPSGPHIFPPSRIPELLAEHHNHDSHTYAPHAYVRDNVLGTRIGDTFANYLSERQARTGEQGVMVALKDDLGVLETLNHDRHQPEQVFNATVGHAPDKDAFQCTAAELEVRRKLQSYNVFNMLMQQIADRAQTETAGYQATHTRTQGRTTVGGVVSAPAGSAVSGVTRVMTPDEKRLSAAQGVEKAQQKLRDNFHEYVNVADFQAFKMRFEAAVKTRDQQLAAFDKDYTEWLIQRTPALKQALGWMKDCPVSAIFLMPIMLRGLLGNVMTEYSHRLWHDHLLKPEASSLLVSTLGLQDPAMVKQLTEKLTADESHFIDSLLTAKNLIKLNKELNKFVGKVGIQLIQETALALLSRPLSVVKEGARASLEEMHTQWKPLLARFNNVYRYLNGQGVLQVVELSMPASDHYNFIRSLPKQFSTYFEPGRMRALSTYQDNEGYRSVTRHQPYDRAAPKADEPTVRMYLMVEQADLKALKQFEHGGERLCTASVVATGESFPLHAETGRKLQMAFANVTRKDLEKLGSGIVGLYFAYTSLSEAVNKANDTIEDLTGLVSSLLGATKAVTGIVDTTRKGFTASADVSELRLLADTHWCKQIGQASNLLGLVTAGFELIHAAQAARDGEPDRVVRWMWVGGGVSVVLAVMAFMPQTAGLGLLIGAVTIVLGALFTVLTAQALSLAQRLWVHRGVFGLHHHRFHDSEAFGATSNTGALIYLDRMTNALQIQHPFGGEKPFGLAPEALKAYHEKALNEETDALAMLVRGITLEIDVSPGMGNVDRYFPEYRRAQQADAPAENKAMAYITLSVPAKVDGFIKLELISNEELSGDNFEEINSPLKLRYKKLGEEIILVEGALGGSKNQEFKRNGDVFVLRLNRECNKKHYRLEFSLSTIGEEFIPVAKDSASFEG